MGTKRTFQDMLNEYLPNELLKEETIKRDYVLTNMQKDNNWKGGKLIVPFRGSRASSIRAGGLTATGNIAQSRKVRGSIDDYKEFWGSLVFDQRDLMEHDGRMPDSTFLSLLPDELEDHMDYTKEVVSVQLGTGPHFATLTADGTAAGIVVDKIDRFELDQEFVLVDGDTAEQTLYVTGIDVNSKLVTPSATRKGATFDCSAFTTAQAAKCYHPGVYDAAGNFETFYSMRMALLSAANGGSDKVHGVSKLKYPILQAVNIDGSGITAANIVTKLFDAYTEVRERSKGRATEFLMSLKHFGSVMKILEADKGPYRTVEAPKESLFGWMEMTIANVTGQVVKIVGIQEMDDDIIPLVDWRSITFRTNGYFKKRISPDGREYFEVRGEDGYQYVVDTCLFGESEYKKPGHSAIIHSISY